MTLLREDGSGCDYTHPGEEGRDPSKDRYFQLPVAYWVDADEQWSSTLSLPAKAMLLIGLSLQPGFVLPVEKARLWYGISADTAQRGFAELVKRGALTRTRTPKKAPLAPQGFTFEHRHTLQGPFSVERDPTENEGSDVA